jgi:hypothetical protein
MSLKNTSIKARRKSCKMSFMSAWNVAGALVRPNDITKNSKWPWRVRNVVFSMSTDSMHT